MHIKEPTVAAGKKKGIVTQFCILILLQQRSELIVGQLAQLCLSGLPQEKETQVSH